MSNFIRSGWGIVMLLGAVGVGGTFHALYFNYHFDRGTELASKVTALKQQSQVCEARLSEAYEKLNVATNQLNKYVGSGQQTTAFIEDYILPLTKEVDTTTTECLPKIRTYLTQVPELAKQADLEYKLAFNPFYNSDSSN